MFLISMILICLLCLLTFDSQQGFQPNRSSIRGYVLKSNEADKFLEILSAAADTREVDRKIVIDSINRLEKMNSKVNLDPKLLEGKWELIFSSIPGGAANGFLIGGFFNGYFAIKEVIDFYAFTLTSPLGGFKGPSRIVSKSPLIIEYEYREFRIGPIGQEVPSNIRNYKFIYLNKAIAIARISSGGATLLKKIES